MYPFVDPGAAGGSAFEQYLARQDQMKRQAQQDQLALQREQSLEQYRQDELRQGEEALKRQREEADDRIKEKRQQTFERRVHDMLPGDIPDASMLKMDDEFGTGYFPIHPQTNTRTYLGSRADREKIAKDEKIKHITDQLATAAPGSPEFIRLATQYEMEAGKSLPASLAKPATAIRLNFNPRSGAYTLAGSAQPATPEQINSPDVKIERLSEPDPAAAAARDAAKEQREGAHVDSIRKDAINEYDKWLQPIDDQLKASDEAITVMNQETAQADAVLAPMLLKALVVSGGRSAGVRMTQAEINNAVGGATKLEQLKTALNKWSVDPQHAAFTKDQRNAMRKLVRSITDKGYDIREKALKLRRQISQSDDSKEINSYRDDLDQLLHGQPDPSTQPAPSDDDLQKRRDDLLKRAREHK